MAGKPLQYKFNFEATGSGLQLYVRAPNGRYRPATEREVLDGAATIYAQQIKGCDALTSPEATCAYLKAKLSGRVAEAFCVLFLDNRHRPIAFRELFYGTIDGCSVHPRKVVREVIACGAAAVIFAHNHPSGVTEPSQADLRITERLKEALSLVDVRVLDHIIIGEGPGVSFAERGLI